MLTLKKHTHFQSIPTAHRSSELVVHQRKNAPKNKDNNNQKKTTTPCVFVRVAQNVAYRQKEPNLNPPMSIRWPPNSFSPFFVHLPLSNTYFPIVCFFLLHTHTHTITNTCPDRKFWTWVGRMVADGRLKSIKRQEDF